MVRWCARQALVPALATLVRQPAAAVAWSGWVRQGFSEVRRPGVGSQGLADAGAVGMRRRSRTRVYLLCCSHGRSVRPVRCLFRLQRPNLLLFQQLHGGEDETVAGEHNPRSAVQAARRGPAEGSLLRHSDGAGCRAVLSRSRAIGV